MGTNRYTQESGHARGSPQYYDYIRMTQARDAVQSLEEDLATVKGGGRLPGKQPSVQQLEAQLAEQRRKAKLLEYKQAGLSTAVTESWDTYGQNRVSRPGGMDRVGRSVWDKYKAEQKAIAEYEAGRSQPATRTADPGRAQNPFAIR
jgi:hypothetical protein